MLTIQIPKPLALRVEKRAHAEGKRPQTVVVEILEKELPSIHTMQETSLTVHDVLAEEELLAPLDEEWLAMLEADFDEDAAERELEQLAFDPPLSQIIIEDRGPR
jgi:hypothetical protein